MDSNGSQIKSMLQNNSELMKILAEVDSLKLNNYYIAAGAVFQTIWNTQDKLPLMNGIHDIDIIYFDKKITQEDSLEQDKFLEKKLNEKFQMEFDIHNEAYMHLWKGRNIKPYSSCEDAMGRWLATVHAIGIKGQPDTLEIYAPFGIDDILHRIIRPIYHVDNSKILYDAKALKWQERFNGLTILQWEAN